MDVGAKQLVSQHRFWHINSINSTDPYCLRQKNGEIFYNSAGRAFSVEEQLYINRQACSAWQMGIVFGQVLPNSILLQGV